MKIAKFFSGIFAVVGSVLMVATVAMCLLSLNAQPRLLEQPKDAKERAIMMMDAVCEGDYKTAGSLMYGQPDLGVDRDPEHEVGVMVWKAFQENFSYEFNGKCYATDSGVALDVTVSSLDISATTASMESRVQSLLSERIEKTEELTKVYDENNNYREDFLAEILRDAAEEALKEDAQITDRKLTLRLVYQDEQWWIMPDAALLQAISGGVA